MPDPLTHTGPFALGVFRNSAGAFPGLVSGARVRDLSDLVPSVRALVEDWDNWLPRLDELARSADGPWHPLTALHVLPPIEPGQILQSGANYRKHVVDLVAAEKESMHGATPEEARADAEKMMDERIRSGVPYVFLGSPRAMCGPYDDIVLPELGEQHDWELELALVIGKSGRNIQVEDAMSYVAAYTICNDLTTRDRLYRPDVKAIGTDWFTAKNADTFLPTGPFLVPAAFVGDPNDLRITLRHNGVVRQDESTKDMIFDIPRLIAYVSTTTTLRPGDLLLTGSPAGNGAHWGVFLKPGDVVESEITGLGLQRNTVRSGQ
ncbi:MULTISPECIES: fumarylacetoacetate hydrolase family protein [Streptomyces]|uniref:4-hydroxyphenylacetate degradation bifunctional isomerase/decarboxylase, C-terminal subunit n=1 Tax=Streptomyces sviceus (strain ATCC 29083 / DSM 924 / JCM 4929 / NBRC 13980 / NCIMB 11184 / NRRL 5439 / UC 5370) TaxID=463191 RepID=B5HRF8_STRX2|nr:MULTISPECIES: fumarylacetoacetate hydrolase family protein [Streptomyces]EDY55413.1 4-hydroxyphenylacetate degradation bifunctional isomerase/decarboxylase, C-terminal subunit [Streptomyces sviceus ATCC 29083]MYT09290.1 hydrolase [Streptomyces sp. SID5470]